MGADRNQALLGVLAVVDISSSHAFGFPHPDSGARVRKYGCDTRGQIPGVRSFPPAHHA